MGGEVGVGGMEALDVLEVWVVCSVCVGGGSSSMKCIENFLVVAVWMEEVGSTVFGVFFLGVYRFWRFWGVFGRCVRCSFCRCRRV